MASGLSSLRIDRACAVALAVAAFGPVEAAPKGAIAVSNLNDSGAGSLRAAIQEANATPGADLISISANGQLNLLSALPQITDAVTITVPGHNTFQVFRIDGQNLHRGLTISAVPVTLTGLTVQNCVAFGNLNGAGIEAGGDLILNSVRVTNCTAGGNGGGVYGAAAVTVNGGRFEDNDADEGGGIYAVGAFNSTNAQYVGNTAQDTGGGVVADGGVQLTGGKFELNVATTGGGGGLQAQSPLTISGTQFLSNTAGGPGGGVRVVGPGPVEISDARFEDNDGFEGGGLLVLTSAGVTALTNVDFVANESLGDGGGGGATVLGDVAVDGGLFEDNESLIGQQFDVNVGGLVATGEAMLTNVDFINNAGRNTGAVQAATIVATGGVLERNRPGALSAQQIELTDTEFLGNTLGPAASAVGIDATNVSFDGNTAPGSAGAVSASDVVLNGCRLANNQGDTGGAVHALGQLTIGATRFLGNGARLGGAVFHAAGDGSIVNSLFADNSATEDGAALFLEGTGTDTFKHLTIAGAMPIDGTAIATSKSNLLIQNAIIAEHVVGIDVSAGSVALSNTLFHGNFFDTQGPLALDANRVSGDPLFVDPANDDYHLQSDSPGVDAGLDAGIGVDFDGDARPAGDGFDIGFDEVADPVLFQDGFEQPPP